MTSRTTNDTGRPVRGGTVSASVAFVAVLPLWVVACGGTARAPIATVEAPVTSAAAPALPASPRLAAASLPIAAAPHPPHVHGVSRLVRRVPVYQGVWAGTSIRQACSEAGGAVGVGCRSLPDKQRLSLRLTQVGSRARGVLELGSVQADVSGAVGTDGTLTLRGVRSDTTHTIRVTGWRSTTNGAVMSGSFAYSITPEDPRLGTVTVSAVIDGMVKGS